MAPAATLAGRPVVTAETFTCAYGWTSLRHRGGRGHSPHQGREQVADLKLICDALFANGTNQIIWHGMPYNRVGGRDRMGATSSKKDTTNFFYTTCQLSTSPAHNLTGQALADFNRYMTRVSDYMRRGTNYSDLAVYMPLEDAWMHPFYPDSVRKVKAFFWGQYEMRFIRTPEAFKGMQPLWVNQHFLSTAEYRGGLLHCGAATFQALYCDVEFMELDALRHILRLSREGLPVYWMRYPKEPGRMKHAEYDTLLAQLRTLRLQSPASKLTDITNRPALVEGTNLPDFWVREDEGTYYIFFANPLSQTISYPLDYCYAFTGKAAERPIVVNHHGRHDSFTLRFGPTESIMLEVTKRGLRQIELGYTPPMLPQ